MNKNFSRLLPAALLLLVVTWYGCKKETPLTLPLEQAHFMNKSAGSYFITAPGVTYKLPIGLTTVSNVDRTINISVTSPTGAVAGTHYTLNKTSFVIPAGKVVDTLVISGVYAQYTAGRKDTLVIKMEGTDKGGVAASTYNSEFKLFMRGPCAEAELMDPTNLQAFMGDYNNTNENYGGAYGPYKTTVTSITPTSATTATITVNNVFDWDWGPVTLTLDWTDLANRKVTLVPHNVGGNAGNLFGATYAGMNYALRPASSGQIGTFSFCNRSIGFFANIGVWRNAPLTPLYSGTLYTVTMQ
jgi:hypothetical protein